jgi:hypothetical protein
MWCGSSDGCRTRGAEQAKETAVRERSAAAGRRRRGSRCRHSACRGGGAHSFGVGDRDRDAACCGGGGEAPSSDEEGGRRHGVSPHRTLSGHVVCLCVFVCVCVCLCVYSRVGASYVGRPICVCAVSRHPSGPGTRNDHSYTTNEPLTILSPGDHSPDHSPARREDGQWFVGGIGAIVACSWVISVCTLRCMDMGAGKGQ